MVDVELHTQSDDKVKRQNSQVLMINQIDNYLQDNMFNEMSWMFLSSFIGASNLYICSINMHNNNLSEIL